MISSESLLKVNPQTTRRVPRKRVWKWDFRKWRGNQTTAPQLPLLNTARRPEMTCWLLICCRILMFFLTSSLFNPFLFIIYSDKMKYKDSPPSWFVFTLKQLFLGDRYHQECLFFFLKTKDLRRKLIKICFYFLFHWKYLFL